MGVVYRARSAEGRDVAVKLLARIDPAKRARFERERRIQEKLGEQEGFVPILGGGDSSAGPYLVMPFVGGGSLREKLRQGKLPLEQALTLGRVLARTLGRAHALGIVHRDVKPENIIFTTDGRPLVADLGLAKHFTDDVPGASASVELSCAGETRGTAGYMAPEQIGGARDVGPAADVFALGAVIYECLTGDPPFLASNTIELMRKLEEGLFEPLRRRVSEAPTWLDATVARALARDAKDRFKDGAELASALEPTHEAKRRGPLLAALGGALVLATVVALALRPRAAPPPPVEKAAPPSLPPRHAEHEDEDRRALLAGVEKIAGPGVPGALVVSGPPAFVLAGGRRRDDTTRAALIAATRLGKGRVVALAHDDFFNQENLRVADTAAFLDNAIAWLTANKEAARIVVHSVIHCEELGVALEKRGHRARVEAEGALGTLEVADLICASTQNLTDAELDRIAGFVERGGGLLALATPWAWKQYGNVDRDDRDLPWNRFLPRAGIFFITDQYLEMGEEHVLAIDPADRDLTARAAVEDLGAASPSRADPGALDGPAHLLGQATRALPPDERLAPGFELVDRTRPVSFPVDPRTPEGHRVALLSFLWNQLPAGKVLPAPGIAPVEGPRTTVRVSLDASVAGWQETGLYAPPGGLVTLELPPALVNRAIVRIGSLTDELWAESVWRRWPRVLLEREVRATPLRLASPQGGLVSIELVGVASSGALEVTIGGVVAAPRYVLGATSDADWRKLREAPAPMAVLESRQSVLVVASDLVRALDDPGRALRALGRHADLLLEAGTLEPLRRDRFVFDPQPRTTYRVSRYPLVFDWTFARTVLDPSPEPFDAWAIYRELARARVRQETSLDGTQELDTDLLTFFVLEGESKVPTWDRLDVDMPVARQYLASNRSYDAWLADPRVGLVTYGAIVREFGWGPFKAAISGAMKEPSSFNGVAKRDVWITRLSRAAGRNLAPYFQSWGVPMTDPARKALEDLPTWEPKPLR
jgi:hypothetical protein